MGKTLMPGVLEELERKFAAKPGEVEIVLALANAYADQGRWEEAVRLYKLAIELDPENGDLYNRLGIVFVSVDDPVEAEESYLQSIRLSPMNPESYYNLGELYRIQHRWSNARYMFEKCLQLTDDLDMRMEVREKLISL